MTPPEAHAMPEIIDYLLGSGTLNGWGWGEKPGKTAPYWWRKHLREYHSTITAQLKAGDDLSTALKWMFNVLGDDLKNSEARIYAEKALASYASVRKESK